MCQYTLEAGHIQSSAGLCVEVPKIGWSDLKRGEKSVRPGEIREGFTEVVALTWW